MRTSKVDVVTFGWTKEASSSYGLDVEVRQLGIIAQQVLLLQMMHRGGEDTSDPVSVLVLPPRNAVVVGGTRVPGGTTAVRCCCNDLMQDDHMFLRRVSDSSFPSVWSCDARRRERRGRHL